MRLEIGMPVRAFQRRQMRYGTRKGLSVREQLYAEGGTMSRSEQASQDGPSATSVVEISPS